MFTYEIIGISPTWHYITIQAQNTAADITYVAHEDYGLQPLIDSVASLKHKHPRDQAKMLEAVYDFWIEQTDSINYWRTRLSQSGRDNVLISRFTSQQNLRQELEALLEV